MPQDAVTETVGTPSMTAAAPAPSDWAIEADGLVRRFGDVTAVDGLDLRVPRGGVYGLLGPNGAGKTTAVRMLCSLSRPDAGRARVLGADVATDGDAVRRRIGLAGQFAAVDADLTGRENLRLLGRLQGRGRRDAAERAGALLQAFGLTDAGDRQVRGYSGGMRRRLDLAASLVVPPDVLFLDEPTAGLDPRSRADLWDVVRALVAAGTTVLLTTQYLEEADALADRIAVLDHGRVVAEGTPVELKARVGAGRVELRLDDAAHAARAATILGDALGTEVRPVGDGRVLQAASPDVPSALAAARAVADAGVPVADVAVGRPSLDEVFLALTGRPPAVPAAPTAAPTSGAVA